MHIAYNGYMAQELQEWGKITSLAKEYAVSRQFVYTLIGIFKALLPQLFASENRLVSISKKELFIKMLSYRMEGRCSIEAIATLMKRDNLSCSSVGMISQTLSSIGKLLPNSIKSDADAPIELMVASDEIFSKLAPILISVDPISSAILSIKKAPNRKGEEWKQHYSELQENGFNITGVVRDEGNGLGLGAKESIPNAIYQVDTYHAVAHRLGLLVEKFEKQAYRLIQVEEASKIKNNHNKKVEEAMDLADNFSYLYRCIINELKPFKAYRRSKR